MGTQPLTRPEVLARTAARFDRSGGPDACHPWTGARTPGGYGVVRARRALAGGFGYAHRLAWEWFNGAEPAPGLEVCHSCDNPPCGNGRHLFVGTHSDNMRDAGRKDRIPWRARTRDDRGRFVT